MWVPHQKTADSDWPYQVTQICFYKLRKLKFQKSFMHCDRKNKPMIAGKDDTIVFFADYSWNGMSVGFNTYNTRRATLVHDGLYQAIRLNVLPRSWRGKTDDEMVLILREDRMMALRRCWIKAGLWLGGSPGTSETHNPCVQIPSQMPPANAVQLNIRP